MTTDREVMARNYLEAIGCMKWNERMPESLLRDMNAEEAAHIRYEYAKAFADGAEYVMSKLRDEK